MSTPTDQQRLIHVLWTWLRAVSWKASQDDRAWIPEDLRDELGNALITVDDWLNGRNL